MKNPYLLAFSTAGEIRKILHQSWYVSETEDYQISDDLVVKTRKLLHSLEDFFNIEMHAILPSTVACRLKLVWDLRELTDEAIHLASYGQDPSFEFTKRGYFATQIHPELNHLIRNLEELYEWSSVNAPAAAEVSMKAVPGSRQFALNSLKGKFAYLADKIESDQASFVSMGGTHLHKILQDFALFFQANGQSLTEELKNATRQ